MSKFLDGLERAVDILRNLYCTLCKSKFNNILEIDFDKSTLICKECSQKENWLIVRQNNLTHIACNGYDGKYGWPEEVHTICGRTLRETASMPLYWREYSPEEAKKLVNCKRCHKWLCERIKRGN